MIKSPELNQCRLFVIAFIEGTCSEIAARMLLINKSTQITTSQCDCSDGSKHGQDRV